MSGDLINMDTVNSIKMIGQLRKKQDYFLKMLDLFTIQTDETLKKLETAVQSEDKVLIYRLSHKIKGGARSIGASDLSNKCLELETWALSEENTPCHSNAYEFLNTIKSSYEKSKKLLLTL